MGDEHSEHDGYVSIARSTCRSSLQIDRRTHRASSSRSCEQHLPSLSRSFFEPTSICVRYIRSSQHRCQSSSRELCQAHRRTNRCASVGRRLSVGQQLDGLSSHHLRLGQVRRCCFSAVHSKFESGTAASCDEHGSNVFGSWAGPNERGSRWSEDHPYGTH